jgi:hypothetical protein
MDFICTDQTIIDVYIIYFYSLYVVLFGGYEDRIWCRRTAIIMDQREIRCQGRSDELAGGCTGVGMLQDYRHRRGN